MKLTSARICLGLGAPGELPELLRRLGLEPLPYAQKQHATLYIDFVGAQPGGIPLLSLDLGKQAQRAPRAGANFAGDNLQAAACFILCHVLGLAPPLLTADAEMFHALRTALAVAPSPVPVILEGETGSGKKTLARLIHRASNARGPFRVLNCATLEGGGAEPPELAASQSLQPADDPLAPAPQATLFLDEIAELSSAAQARFLRRLELDDAAPAAADDAGAERRTRYIGATNRLLSQSVERGELRRDLYWRLNVFSIKLPPLRERPADITLLAAHFLRQANPRRWFTAGALRMLGSYPFPGNVRELSNLAARLAIVPLAAANHQVDLADLRRQLANIKAPEPAAGSGWKVSREEARREMVLRVITACGGNRAEAAHKLGITTRALQYHITKAGLSRRRGAQRIFTGPAGAPALAPQPMLELPPAPGPMSSHVP